MNSLTKLGFHLELLCTAMVSSRDHVPRPPGDTRHSQHLGEIIARERKNITQTFERVSAMVSHLASDALFGHPALNNVRLKPVFHDNQKYLSREGNTDTLEPLRCLSEITFYF